MDEDVRCCSLYRLGLCPECEEAVAEALWEQEQELRVDERVARG